MINFIPNDPRSVEFMPMRRVAARPNRPVGQAGFTVSGNAAQRPYKPSEHGFVQWQARQAAILAVEAWEQVLGAPIKSWAQETDDPKSLMLIPDNGNELNAYYEREALQFYHYELGNGQTLFSGASTDIVAHETGHAILDATRSQLFGQPLPEVAAFHESFGDVTAIITALSDRKTRDKLLEVAPNLGTANFVESFGDDLAAGIRKVAGATNNASRPRRALNTFQWQLPDTMPKAGGPSVMINEFHSISRIMTGCIYDLLRHIFVASGKLTQNSLWSATQTTGQLLHEAARTAPMVPRFYRSIGRAMVLADESRNGGANRDLIVEAFQQHGLALGAQSLLAPEMGLDGAAPRFNRRSGAVTMEASTMRHLRRLAGAPTGAVAAVALTELGNTNVADVSIRTEVKLDDVDPRLHDVVAAVDTVALVGESGKSAALLFAPRTEGGSSDVIAFARSLVDHNQLAFDSRPKSVDAAPSVGYGSTTHEIVRHGNKRELQRIRFACSTAGMCDLGSES